MRCTQTTVVSFQVGSLKISLWPMISNTPPPARITRSRTVRLREPCRQQKILRQTDPFLALMSYRATPIQATGASPAQLMLGRQIRTMVPTVDRVLSPKWPNMAKVRMADARAKAGYSCDYNRRHGARALRPLNPGDSVALKLDGESGWVTAGTVRRSHPSPRSYLIQTENGVLRRNRRHLRPTFSPAQELSEPVSTTMDGLPASPEPSPPDSPDTETVPAEPVGRYHDEPRVTSRGIVIRTPGRFNNFVSP